MTVTFAGSFTGLTTASCCSSCSFVLMYEFTLAGADHSSMTGSGASQLEAAGAGSLKSFTAEVEEGASHSEVVVFAGASHSLVTFCCAGESHSVAVAASWTGSAGSGLGLVLN